MELKIFAPSLQLRSFIKCYYVCESHYTEYVKDVFFPDGSVEVVFHAGTDFYRDDEKECWAKVIGQITQPLTMKAIGEGKSFGIWFLPHTFSLFSGISMNELNDKTIPLDTIFSQAFIDLVKNCLLENDVNGLVEGTNIYLSRRLNISSNPVKEKIVEHAIQYILTKKAGTDLDKLVKDCNISNRYLQKIFIERIGFSPKFFIRIVRFQYALHLLTGCRPDSLTALTYLAGYYDQAHFIRDFKEFTGSAPSQFHLAKHPINQHFLGL
ncbi:MAG TPA: helix-turn-helix domain-containing protein [Mucilaginibacter sp.]|nr:helix-turn-helix domain-containing protein [Mucilaginibacter sp.]